jgi:TonB family protein
VFFSLPFLPAIDAGITPREPDRAPDLRKATPLIAPRYELTQKMTNKGKPAKEVDLESLMPRPPIRQAPVFRPPVAASPNPGHNAVLPDAPKIEAPDAMVAQLPPQGVGTAIQPPPPAPTPPQTAQQPKITFESVPSNSSSAGNRQGVPGSRIQIPKSSVDEVAQGIARNRGGGGVVVGDLEDPGIMPGITQAPAAGRQASTLELLSDPQGIDFKPYLIRILTSVRRNWFAVMPESAKLGRRGRVVIQFAISRDGRVPKLVIASPSGADALDRAAVAGVSASNPFPPLPNEFKGEQIRLQFAFSYNMPTNR